MVKLPCTYLFSDEVVDKINWRRFKEQIVRYDIVEEAGIAISETTGGNQQRYGHRNSQVHRESVAEALDKNLASEFTWRQKIKCPVIMQIKVLV